MKNQDSDLGKTNTLRLTKRLLKEIKLGKSETLDTLIEILESTLDPDPSELYMLESLYQLKEKMVLVESRMSTYLAKSKSKFSEDKLSDLYENSTSFGTSKLFKY